MFMANMGTTVVDVPVYVKPKPVLKITQEKIESIKSPETNCNFGPVRIPRTSPAPKFPFNAPKVREEDLLIAKNLVNTPQGQAEIDALTTAEDPVIIFD